MCGPHHADTANLRRGLAWEDQQGPFTRLNRTIDVRRIAPAARRVAPAGPTPLRWKLRSTGRAGSTSPDIAVWMWRWQSWRVTKQAAFNLGRRRLFLSSAWRTHSALPATATSAGAVCTTDNQGDTPQPITRRAAPVKHGGLLRNQHPAFRRWGCGRRQADHLRQPDGGEWQGLQRAFRQDRDRSRARAHSICADVPRPRASCALLTVWVWPRRSAAAHTTARANLEPPAKPDLTAIVGTAKYPTLESAVAAWNVLPGGSTGIIVMPNYRMLCRQSDRALTRSRCRQRANC